MSLENPIFTSNLLTVAEQPPRDSEFLSSFNSNNLITQGTNNVIKNSRRSTIINGSNNLSEGLFSNHRIGSTWETSSFELIEYKNHRQVLGFFSFTPSVFLVNYNKESETSGLLYRHTELEVYLSDTIGNVYSIENFALDQSNPFGVYGASSNYFIKSFISQEFESLFLERLNHINEYLNENFEYILKDVGASGRFIYLKYPTFEEILYRTSQSACQQLVDYFNLLCVSNLVSVDSNLLIFNFEDYLVALNEQSRLNDHYYELIFDLDINVFNMWNKSNQFHVLCENGIKVSSGVEYFNASKIYKEGTEVVYTTSQPLSPGSLENSSNKIRVGFDASLYLNIGELIFIEKEGVEYDASNLDSYLEFEVESLGSDANGYFISINEVYTGESINNQQIHSGIIHGKYERAVFLPGTSGYFPDPYMPPDAPEEYVYWKILELNIDIKKYLAISNSIQTRNSSDIYCKGDVIASNLSDKRLKQGIKPINNCLSKINKINAVKFSWNLNQGSLSGNFDIGLLAQEVEESFPEVVLERSNGVKAINYKKMCAILVQCIKEKQEKIEKLKIKLRKINE